MPGIVVEKKPIAMYVQILLVNILGYHGLSLSWIMFFWNYLPIKGKKTSSLKGICYYSLQKILVLIEERIYVFHQTLRK